MARLPLQLPIPQPEPAVIDWLLDADPAIRWQVVRERTGAPAEEVTAEK